MCPMGGPHAARSMHALKPEPTGDVSAGALLYLLGVPAADVMAGLRVVEPPGPCPILSLLHQGLWKPESISEVCTHAGIPLLGFQAEAD